MRTTTYRSTLAVFASLPLLAVCGGPEAPPAAEATELDAPPVAGAPASTAGPEASSLTAALGTIQATVDGRPMTWYVVSGTLAGQRYASAMWMGDAPDDRQILAIGFDSPAPPVETFERSADRTAVSYGDYQGPVMTLHVTDATGPLPKSIAITAEGIGIPDAGAFYQQRATVENFMDATFWLTDGRIEITAMAIEGGEGRIEGTFSGVFRSGAGESLRMTDGRFQIRGIPDMAALMP